MTGSHVCHHGWGGCCDICPLDQLCHSQYSSIYHCAALNTFPFGLVGALPHIRKTYLLWKLITNQHERAKSIKTFSSGFWGFTFFFSANVKQAVTFVVCTLFHLIKVAHKCNLYVLRHWNKDFKELWNPILKWLQISDV